MAVYFKGVKSSYGLTPLPYLSEFTVEITFKDSSLNNNNIKCYNCDLINKEVIYNNLKMQKEGI